MGKYRLDDVRTTLLVALVLVACLLPAYSRADSTCPNAELFGSKLISGICWSCIFPMRIGGVTVGGGNLPDGAAPGQAICACNDNLGVPHIGTQISMWEPARLIELVRRPYCSPALNGAVLRDDIRRFGTQDGDKERSFYHYHYFAFPLLFMMDLFAVTACNSDGYVDFDIMYLSELDPTWNDDELAFFMNPEAALFANPLALTACMGDAAMASAGHPTEKMYWCAGSWGNLYPFTGNAALDAGSPPRVTSLLTARAIAALHRRGLARKTMGEDAMCGGYVFPTIPKSQYKYSTFFPIPEVSGDSITGKSVSGSHWLGESTYTWGEWRNIPAAGEDFMYLIWRWKDCCSTF